jgi:deoxyadenosine/deoxycytidine kinase
MKIAVSGTHCVGKTTLIEDFLAQHPEYHLEVEAYYKLESEQDVEHSLEPSIDSLQEQLECSIEQLQDHNDKADIIYDRCPVDYLAYAMCALEEDNISINNSELSNQFDEIKEALDHLDLIIFIPLSNENAIEYTEENPQYRIAADRNFKLLYRDEVCDIFPGYNNPRIVELSGDRQSRLTKLESLL